MKKYIKRIPVDSYRPIGLFLIFAVASLFTPILGWTTFAESLLSCLVFLFLAMIFFLAALCDVLKSVIDTMPVKVKKDGEAQ